MNQNSAVIAIPGVKVGCTYREGFGHTGRILALDDPAAWSGTLAFFGPEYPDPARVTAHVARCLAEIQGFASKVPVSWSFGRVYWERLDALYPID